MSTKTLSQDATVKLKQWIVLFSHNDVADILLDPVCALMLSRPNRVKGAEHMMHATLLKLQISTYVRGSITYFTSEIPGGVTTSSFAIEHAPSCCFYDI